VQNALTGETHTVTGRIVVNCAGPRVRDLARGRGGDTERLFRPSLAFNLLLDTSLPVDCALAVAAPQAGAPMLFLVPKQGALLAGTMHLPRSAETANAVPTDVEIAGFLALLNQAIPGLDVRPGNVRRVFAGLLPAAAPGSADLLKREVLEDHGKVGGPKGLYSVSGVKFTTANDVARQLLDMIKPDTNTAVEVVEMPLSPATAMLTDARLLASGDDLVDDALRRVVADESVQCIEDLVLRRTNWATTELDLESVVQRLAGRLGCPESMPRSAICA
jgi:glycerol-3-phosphate dehydrogenase